MDQQYLSAALTLAIAALSGYAATRSSASVQKLLQYEERAQKAAEWSNVAEQRLHQTRYTVGWGFTATMASSMSAVSYLVFVCFKQSEISEWTATRWPALLSFCAYGVMVYMRRFWGTKAKIPLMDDYNSAISDSKMVVKLLSLLSVMWAGLTFLRVAGL